MPVAAFAQPELARIARSPSSWQRSRLSSTGAAGVAVAVKRAALTGRSASQTSSARSGLPLGLIPHVTPAALKPAGSPASRPSSRTCAGAGTQRERKNGRGGPSELAVAVDGFAGAHSSPLVSGRPNIRLRFCTACEEVPFQRLSIAPNAITLPVCSSAAANTRQ